MFHSCTINVGALNYYYYVDDFSVVLFPMKSFDDWQQEPQEVTPDVKEKLKQVLTDGNSFVFVLKLKNNNFPTFHVLTRKSSSPASESCLFQKFNNFDSWNLLGFPVDDLLFPGSKPEKKWICCTNYF